MKGLKSQLDKLSGIETLPVDLTGRRASFREWVELAPLDPNTGPKDRAGSMWTVRMGETKVGEAANRTDGQRKTMKATNDIKGFSALTACARGRTSNRSPRKPRLTRPGRGAHIQETHPGRKGSRTTQDRGRQDTRLSGYMLENAITSGHSLDGRGRALDWTLADTGVGVHHSFVACRRGQSCSLLTPIPTRTTA